MKGLYASFDVFPSAKGSATHIGAVAPLLFSRLDGGILYVLGGDQLPTYQAEESVEVFRFSESIPNYLERSIAYSRSLAQLVARRASEIAIAQFRDPWSGLAIVHNKAPNCRLVYEVNGLPSIELPTVYPALSPRTRAKIRSMEEECWSAADRIVVPSATIAANLTGLGVPSDRLRVVPNGAEIPPPFTPPEDAPGLYILYFGALQKWQGVDVLLRALSYLRDIDDLHLVICASTRHRYAKSYRKIAERLGVDDRVVWRYGLNKRELGAWIAGSTMTIAPLTECSRNIEQGCAPLKILESMAAAIPVVASDLPAVREIMVDGEHGRLVRAERPSELARVIRLLLADDNVRLDMGRRAQEHIARGLTWRHSLKRLDSIYSELLPVTAQA